MSKEKSNKPKPPIGGTDVFQIPETGTNYWYSKLKGSDLFMCLQFADITKKDLLIDASGNKRVFSTKREQKFKRNALHAIETKPTTGFLWIPAYEPSMGEIGGNPEFSEKYELLKGKNDELHFIPGKKVLRALNTDRWEQLFYEYSPRNGSRLASKTTHFLLLMRWLKDGYATLDQIVHKSTKIGHYCDSENVKLDDFEKTGERQFGGLWGYVGNTEKLVVDPESPTGFSQFGGWCGWYGTLVPLASSMNGPPPHSYSYFHATGLMELTK